MTQSTRVIENKLKWTTDQASVQATIGTHKAIGGSLQAIRKEADAVYEASVRQAEAERALKAAYALGNPAEIARVEADRAVSAQRAADNARVLAVAQEQEAAAARGATQATQTYTVSQQQSANAAGNAATQQLRLADATSKAVTASRASVSGGINTGQIASRVAGFGALVGSQAGGQVFPAVAQVIQLGSAFGVAGVAAGVYGLALRSVTDAQEKAAKSAQDYIQALSGTAGQTSAEIQKQIDAQTVYKQSLEEARVKLLDFETQFDALAQPSLAAVNAADVQAQEAIQAQFQAIYKNLSESTGGLITNSAQLDAALAQSQTEIDGVNGKIGFYNSLLNTQGVANANAAARLEATAKLQQKLADEQQGGIEARAAREVELARITSDGTTEQINARLAADRATTDSIRSIIIPGIEAMGLSVDETARRTEPFNQQLAVLRDTEAKLLQAALPLVQAREREAIAAQALIDRSDAVNDALKEMRDVQHDLAKASADAAEASKALRDAQTENAANERHIATETAEKIADIQRKSGERLLDIDAKSAERLLQQKENDNLSIEAAIARGDIAQAQQILAQQRVRETQERRNVETQKQDAQQQAKEQLDNAREQGDKLLDAERRRYNKEYEQRYTAHQKALEQEQALLNAQESLRQQNAHQTDYWNSVVAASVGNLSNQFYNAVGRMNEASARLQAIRPSNPPVHMSIAQFAAGVNPPVTSNVLGAYQYLGSAQGAYSPFPQPSSSYVNPHVFDTPSYNTRPGIYESRVPEAHIPLADFNRMGGMGSRTVNATFYIAARAWTKTS